MITDAPVKDMQKAAAKANEPSGNPREFLSTKPPSRMRGSLLCCLLVCMVGVVLPTAVQANETDQFLMPEDEGFVDLGHLMNIVHYRALRELVDKTNDKIARASDESRSRYYEPSYLARQFQASFGPGFFEMMNLEDALRVSQAKQRRGEGEITAYRPMDWIYFFAHLPIDPRNGVLLFQSSTILVDGVYMGVDKWGHFHDLGNIYFQDYLTERNAGKDHQEAVDTIVQRFSRGIISEAAVIGAFATGVQSNGDLAANYAGFKFYSNLTEPVSFNGQKLPPLLVRHGAFWRLNEHVRPDATFLNAFVSDHWNEALNPGRIEAGLRVAVKRRLQDNSDRILNFYTRHDERPRSRAYFEQLAQELSTFNGESYGYLPISDDEATIALCCFDDDDASSGALAGSAELDQPDAPRQEVLMRQVRLEETE